jgi:hypothetical protein
MTKFPQVQRVVLDRKSIRYLYHMIKSYTNQKKILPKYRHSVKWNPTKYWPWYEKGFFKKEITSSHNSWSKLKTTYLVFKWMQYVTELSHSLRWSLVSQTVCLVLLSHSQCMESQSHSQCWSLVSQTVESQSHSQCWSSVFRQCMESQSHSQCRRTLSQTVLGIPESF